MLQRAEQIQQDLLRPVIAGTGQGSAAYRIALALAAGVFLAGVGAFGYQLYAGIGVWGIDSPVLWAFDIANFVFWMGIGHTGALISATLRLANVSWRRPVTRCAEALTIFALLIGAMIPLGHIGRPWLAFWVIPYPNERRLWPNFRSPLAWDCLTITTYLAASIVFLYLTAVPDFAAIRDTGGGLRKRACGLLALGWQGKPRQWQRLKTAVRILAIAIIPLALSAQTFVFPDFAITPLPMWNAVIFGPYFLVAALFSGCAALILVMALMRKFLHLEEYLEPIHFQNLGKFLLGMSLLWFSLLFAGRIVPGHGSLSAMADFWAGIRWQAGPLFWIMVFCNFVVPLPLLAIKRLRTVAGTALASSTVIVGVWIEGYLVIVPSLEHKFLPYSWGGYRPTWVEDILVASSFGLMLLLYLLFARLVPVISIWEMKAGLPPNGRVPSIAAANGAPQGFVFQGPAARDVTE